MSGRAPVRCGTFFRRSRAASLLGIMLLAASAAAAQIDEQPRRMRRWAVAGGVSRTSAGIDPAHFSYQSDRSVRGINLSARYDLSPLDNGRGTVSAFLDTHVGIRGTFDSESGPYGGPFGQQRETVSASAFGLGVSLRQHLRRRPFRAGVPRGVYFLGGGGLYYQRATRTERFTPEPNQSPPYHNVVAYDRRFARSAWTAGYVVGFGTQTRADWYGEIVYTGGLSGLRLGRAPETMKGFLAIRIGKRV